MSDIIISLITIPSRARYLSRFLASIDRQSVLPSKIEINIPTEYNKRNLGTVDKTLIPSDLDVYECEDYGPATKLLPTLKRYAGTDTRIIYCDDDRIYNHNWIHNLVSSSDCNPASAICDEFTSVRKVERRYHNRNRRLRKALKNIKKSLLFGRYQPCQTNNNDATDIAEGFGGVLIRPSFFPDMVFSIPDILWSVDDIWLSGVMTLNGTPIHWSGRCLSEKSAPMTVDGHDLGRQPEALTLSQFDGFDRLSADYYALNYFQRNFGIWGGIIPASHRVVLNHGTLKDLSSVQR